MRLTPPTLNSTLTHSFVRAFDRAFVRALLLASLLAAAPAILSPGHAFAQQAHEEKKPFDPEQMLEDATRELMRTLELFLSAIPQYAPPEILENGDIIIRRIHPKPGKRQPSGDGVNTPEQT